MTNDQKKFAISAAFVVAIVLFITIPCIFVIAVSGLFTKYGIVCALTAAGVITGGTLDIRSRWLAIQ